MLKPRKNRLFESVFALYNRNLLRRRFGGFRLKGSENLLTEPDRSRIIIANHSTWWDGLIAFEISRWTGLDAYVMMEERQLARYGLFRLLGAFSVDRTSPRSAFRSLDFAADLLDSPNPAALWIFPQGEIRPAGARPLGFETGVGEIAGRSVDSIVVPVAVRCEFGEGFKPEIYAEAGSPLAAADLTGNRREITAALETTLEGLLSELERNLENREFGGFEDII